MRAEIARAAFVVYAVSGHNVLADDSADVRVTYSARAVTRGTGPSAYRTKTLDVFLSAPSVKLKRRVWWADAPCECAATANATGIVLHCEADNGNVDITITTSKSNELVISGLDAQNVRVPVPHAAKLRFFPSQYSLDAD
jgi:hypothetical protein